MKVLLLPFPMVLALFQVSGVNPLIEYGVLGAMLIFVAAMWERDSAARRQSQKESDERYAVLVKLIVDMVQVNTTAQTRLADVLGQRPCLVKNIDHLKTHAKE